ncbi:interferon-induced protein 44-like [Seriola aureovittata]|uniref:interferon-induced protein 44-like n=1 Tax=Seriola aureovittata TaxID=2871759 RepID=UPI0024BE911A|nr:interferon-induced protein 44-like [Seriola aureovittata]
MGSGDSRPSPPPSRPYKTPTPPPSPTFRDPWRNVSWGHNEEDLKYLKDYQPEIADVRHLRVLLYGPVGAGKSSFINSVSNVLVGRMTQSAGVSATTSDQSHTKKYETHKIQKGSRGNFYPVVFNDIMGLEEKTGGGVRADDIKLAMKGHVKEGYKFNPASSLSSGDPGYNPSPSLDDRVHVLVCLHNANITKMEELPLMKMKEIREAASDLGIPQLAIVTKVDEACGETEKDLKNVYKSKHIKKKMKDFSSSLGIPMNCIFPVKNYSEEISTDENINTLILSALRLIVDFGDDFITSCDK